MRVRKWVLTVVPFGLACTGSISGGLSGGPDDPGGPGGSSADPANPGDPNNPSLPPDVIIAPPGTDPVPVDPMNTMMAQACEPSIPAAPLRRLSYAEYQSTLKDVTGSLNMPAPSLLRDPLSHGFENQAKLLNPSPLLVEQYGNAAIDTGIKLAVSLSSSLLPCQPKAATEEKTCGAQFVASFGAKAFRRPLTAIEKTDYEGYFETERSMSNFAGAVQMTAEVMLQSPQFLYRLEFGDPATAAADRIKLTPYEVATRMSYLLSGTAPDAALLVKAQGNLLDGAADREAEARRLLGDPRAQAMFVEFHRQWLDLDKLDREPKDTKTFPTYTPALQSAIREETDRFVADLMGSKGDGTLKSFLTSTKTQVNADLGKLYGVTGPASGWATVDLKANERTGYLTRSNFLASRAHMLSGSPPLRANYVLGRFLCQSLPPPPANADLSEPAKTSTGAKTNRQLFEERTSPATCNACHSTFSALGFALENYDAIGRYRTTDNGLPVDATARFQLGDFDWQLTSGVDLSQKIADHPAAQACAASNWFEYALGRDIDTPDQCRMAKLNLALGDAKGDIREMLIALVKSPEFVYRTPIVP